MGQRLLITAYPGFIQFGADGTAGVAAFIRLSAGQVLPVGRAAEVAHLVALFTSSREVFEAGGLRTVATLPRTSRMNAICERVIDTLRVNSWTGS
ncbi:hypothetical protein ACFQYP_19130 [Nonomuraea antimicrobica]